MGSTAKRELSGRLPQWWLLGSGYGRAAFTLYRNMATGTVDAVACSGAGCVTLCNSPFNNAIVASIGRFSTTSIAAAPFWNRGCDYSSKPDSFVVSTRRFFRQA